jgi:hypothetical protein
VPINCQRRRRHRRAGQGRATQSQAGLSSGTGQGHGLEVAEADIAASEERSANYRRTQHHYCCRGHNPLSGSFFGYNVNRRKRWPILVGAMG